MPIAIFLAAAATLGGEAESPAVTSGAQAIPGRRVPHRRPIRPDAEMEEEILALLVT